MTIDNCLHPEFIDDCLRGSPYSIPLDADSMPDVRRTLTQAAELTEQAKAAKERIVRELRGLLGINARSREIFESNRIEGVGTADLRGTVNILRSPTADAVRLASNRFDLVRAIDADDRTRDVLGLHAAKLFAEELVADPTRPLTEIDLRSMHQQILRIADGIGPVPRPQPRVSDRELRPRATRVLASAGQNGRAGGVGARRNPGRRRPSDLRCRRRTRLVDTHPPVHRRQRQDGQALGQHGAGPDPAARADHQAPTRPRSLP